MEPSARGRKVLYLIVCFIILNLALKKKKLVVLES